MTTQELERIYQSLLKAYIARLAKAIEKLNPERAKLFEVTQGLKLVASQRAGLVKAQAERPAPAVPFKIRLYNPPQQRDAG